MNNINLFQRLTTGCRFQRPKILIKAYSNNTEVVSSARDVLERPKELPNALTLVERKRQKCNVQKSIKIATNDVTRGCDSDDDESSIITSDVSDKNCESSSASDNGDSDGATSLDDERDEDIDKSETETLTLLGALKGKGGLFNRVNRNEERKRQRKKRKRSEEELRDLIEEEQVNHIRNLKRIHVYGTDMPKPVESFDQLVERFNLSQRLMDNLRSSGYKEPTPVQMQCIPVMLDRREILACAPTGSGKTAAFLVPILHHLERPQTNGFRALILAPTRELAKQTYRECCRLADGLGFRIRYIQNVAKVAQKFGKKASTKIDILISTPNRLVYLLKRDPPAISLKNIEWLIIDESDKLFEGGRTGFREQIAMIYRACDSNNVRRAMFSATVTSEVEGWCKLNLNNLVQVYVGTRNVAVSDVKQQLMFVGSEMGKLLAIRNIIKKGFSPPVLVFVQSIERANELRQELAFEGFNVELIHSDRTQAQRDEIVKAYRLGKIWILICTDLMGRGIDFKGVNLVINYDFPPTAISYIHRIGRTGRAGHEGQAITFFTEDDAVNLRSIANVMKEAGCPVPDYMLKLKKPTKKVRRKLSLPKRDSIRTIPRREILKARMSRRK